MLSPLELPKTRLLRLLHTLTPSSFFDVVSVGVFEASAGPSTSFLPSGFPPPLAGCSQSKLRFFPPNRSFPNFLPPSSITPHETHPLRSFPSPFVSLRIELRRFVAIHDSPGKRNLRLSFGSFREGVVDVQGWSPPSLSRFFLKILPLFNFGRRIRPTITLQIRL